MANYEDGATTFSYDGGVGSISFTLAEIAEAGAALARLAQLMDPLVDRLQAEWLWLGKAAEGATAYPHGPLDTMRNALWACLRVQADTASLAHKTAQAADTYAATEAHNASMAAQVQRLTTFREGLSAWSWGPLGPVKVAVDLGAQIKSAQRGGLRDAVEKWLNNGTAYGAGLLGPGVGLAYLLSQLRGHDDGTAGSRPAFALRKFVDAAGFSRPGHLAIRQIPAQEWDATARQWPPGHAISDPGRGEPWLIDASVQGMLTGSMDAYGYPPGSIGVVRIVRPDEGVAWVVHLPGTEDWSTFDSSNPFDMEGNLEGLTAAQGEQFRQQQILVQELIKESLKASGAAPNDEVLLTGHSGGGIHAAAAAADPDFLAGVNVKMIVIAGSPAKNLDVPGFIAVLDLQNENDIVTAVDFGPPTPSPNWVTVTSHRPPVAGEADLGSVLKNAHALENYLEDAAVLDSGANPAVRASTENLRAFLGVGVGAGALVRGAKFVYQGRDVDDVKKGTQRPSGRQKPAQGADFTPRAR